MVVRVPVASLRWHYPDQVQGYFSPGHLVVFKSARTPSFASVDWQGVYY
jgi:hypothetical protein